MFKQHAQTQTHHITLGKAWPQSSARLPNIFANRQCFAIACTLSPLGPGLPIKPSLPSLPLVPLTPSLPGGPSGPTIVMPSRPSLPGGPGSPSLHLHSPHAPGVGGGSVVSNCSANCQQRPSSWWYRRILPDVIVTFCLISIRPYREK